MCCCPLQCSIHILPCPPPLRMQVLYYLLLLYALHPFPLIISFDDMCHLARYAMNPTRMEASPKVAQFVDTVIKVGERVWVLSPPPHSPCARSCVPEQPLPPPPPPVPMCLSDAPSCPPSSPYLFPGSAHPSRGLAHSFALAGVSQSVSQSVSTSNSQDAAAWCAAPILHAWCSAGNAWEAPFRSLIDVPGREN